MAYMQGFSGLLDSKSSSIIDQAAAAKRPTTTVARNTGTTISDIVREQSAPAYRAPQSSGRFTRWIEDVGWGTVIIPAAAGLALFLILKR